MIDLLLQTLMLITIVLIALTLTSIIVGGDILFLRPYLIKRKTIKKINEIVKKDGWVVTEMCWFTTRKRKRIISMYIKFDKLKKDDIYDNHNLSFSWTNGNMNYDLDTKICTFDMIGYELNIKSIQL